MSGAPLISLQNWVRASEVSEPFRTVQNRSEPFEIYILDLPYTHFSNPSPVDLLEPGPEPGRYSRTLSMIAGALDRYSFTLSRSHDASEVGGLKCCIIER